MIQDIYTNFTSTINSFAGSMSGGEPMAKGLIVVGLLGALVALGRGLPTILKNALMRKLMVSIKIEEGGDDMYGHQLFQAMSVFVAKNTNFKEYIATLEWSSKEKKSAFVLVPDYGSHWFFHKGRIFFYKKSEASGDRRQVPGSVSISTFGSDPAAIWSQIDNIEDLTHRKKQRNYEFFSNNSSAWFTKSRMEVAPPLFIPRATKEKLDASIDFFKGNEEWYRKRGMPYKLTIILYGVPGTGKTSITRYIADRLDYSIGSLKLDTLMDDEFTTALIAAGDRSVVVSIQDFDISRSASKRNGIQDSDQSSDRANQHTKKEITLGSEFTKGVNLGVSLSGMLNSFQGDIPLNRTVTVLTTNCIDQIDPAMLRKGRCDLLLEVGMLSWVECEEFYHHYYEIKDSWPSDLMDISIKGCDLTGAFIDNPFEHIGFIETIRELVNDSRAKP